MYLLKHHPYSSFMIRETEAKEVKELPKGSCVGSEIWMLSDPTRAWLCKMDEGMRTGGGDG